jgi:hypothetical protein
LPNFFNWLLGVAMVYSVLFGLGQLLFGTVTVALLAFALAIGAGITISRNLARSGWQTD